MRYLLLALFLVGCGPIPDPTKSYDPRDVSHNSTFDPYIQRYVAEKGYGLHYDIPIGFTHIDGDIIGVCTRWSNGYRQIEIDIDYWNSASEQFRLSLIAHELGHCDLNRDHSPYMSSIMYYQNWGSLNFEELFGRSTTSTKLSMKVTTPHDEHDGCVHDIKVE